MENKSSIMNITVKGVIDIIFRNKKIIVITFIFCILMTLIGIQFMTPYYDANVKMLVRGQNVISSESYAPIMGSVHMTQAEIVKSRAVLKRTAIALGLQNRAFDYEKQYCSVFKTYYIDYQVKKITKELNKFPPDKQEEMKLDAAIGDLKDRLTVSMVPGTDIFVINVAAFTPEEAVETANIISRSYTLFDQIQQLAEVRIRYGELHPTVIQLEDNIRDVTSNLSGKALPDIEAIGTASVKVIEQATSTGKPIGKSKRIILAVALLVSFVLSFGLAFVIGFLNQTIKSPQDIVEYLNIPCIGSIPKKKRKDAYLITDDSPLTDYYDFNEELAEQLHVFLKTQGLKSVVITSPAYNINHKFVAPNVAYFLSEIFNRRVLLVDANYNNPTFRSVFFPKKGKVKTSEVPKDITPELLYQKNDKLDIQLTEKSILKIPEILRDNDLKTFTAQMKDRYDLIIVDATSVNNTKDISRISECCDGAVLVIDEGTTNRQMLKNSLPRITRHDAVIIGGILNNRTFPIPNFIYKYFKYLID